MFSSVRQGLWMSMRHDVLFVVATRIKFMCPMNYATFPMDRQTCKFQVGKDITRYPVTLDALMYLCILFPIIGEASLT